MRLFFLTLALADTAAAQPAGFRAVPAEAVQWQPIPNGQGAQSALIAGNPSQPGTYVIRVKFPPHVMDRPHHHSRDRHVTVLQGRWVAGTGLGGATDLNTIPLAIVERIEVLEDGASSLYGSDAIAGVVNFKLRDIEGLELGGSYSLTGRGDAARYQFNAAIGSAFDDGRGAVTMYANYTRRDPLFADQRVQFVGVNVRDSAETALAFDRKFGITYPSILDSQSGSVVQAFTGVVTPQAVPTTLVLDRDGKVSARVLGRIDKSILATLIKTVVEE